MEVKKEMEKENVHQIEVSKNVYTCMNCKMEFREKSHFYWHKKFCARVLIEKYGQKVIKIRKVYNTNLAQSKFYEDEKSCGRTSVEEVKKEKFKTCEYCNKDLYSKSSFYLHKKMCELSHFDVLQLHHVQTPMEARTPSYMCCGCGKAFFARSTYYDHKKKCRDIDSDQKMNKRDKYTCREDACSYDSLVPAEFLKHLRDVHSIEYNEEVKMFENYSEFEEWKEKFEKLTKASFTSNHTKKMKSGETIKHFVCNRSGSYKSQSTGKRRMKSQGLTKIGFKCPASIRVSIKDLKPIKVTICPLHYGHDNEVAHLRLSKSDRELIASQLSSGIERSQVLQNLFSSIPDDLEQKHLTRQDLRNISRAYGIDKRAKDFENFYAYVEENLNNEKSIFLYKRENECVQQYPKDEECPLEKEDFALGIMTDFQSEMFKKFGHNIVYIDATHKTNSYDFKLITLLVVDEFNEGIPVAWLLSNRETYTLLKLFFTFIKRQTGNISSTIIVSDKVPQYYSAWNDTFEGQPKKLLCLWHVHRYWRKNLNKIKDKNLASTLYEGLCILLKENEEEKFNELLKKSLQEMHENELTKEFASYFEAEWVSVKQEWAKCFRIGSKINTSMYIRSFRKFLKCYLKGNQNRRIDSCLCILLKFSRDLPVKRLKKLEKGKNSPKVKVTAINSHHRKSLELPLSLVRRISPDSWEVDSETTITSESLSAHVVYLVVKMPECNKSCILKCQYCNICIHSYTCNCPDSMVKSNICKHIHLVVRNLEHDNSLQYIENVNQNDNENVSEDFSDFNPEYILEQLASQSSANLSNLKSTLVEKTMALCELIQNCEDKDILLTVEEHINSASSVMNLKDF